MLHAGGGFRSVRHGDHGWARGEAGLLPTLGRFPPVVAQQVVAVANQIRQRFGWVCPSIQIILHFRIVVYVVQARFVGGGIRHRIVAHHHSRRLHQSRFNGVVQAEVADDPIEQRLFGTGTAGGREGRGGEVVAAQHATRSVDAIQAADPLGGRFHFVTRNAPRLPLARHAPGMMRFVVQHQNVLRPRHLAQHVAHVRLVALGATLVHAAAAGNALVRLPIERMPIAHAHPSLPKPVQQRRRHNVERLEVVLQRGGLQHRQATLHGEPGRHHQHVLGEALVLGLRDLVQHLPRDHHRHHDGLAGAGGHLGAHALKRAAVGRHIHADFLRIGRFRQPDQRLHRLQLAEEQPRFRFLALVPVVEQAPSDCCDTRIPRFPPRLHPRANRVDERNLDEHAGIVERTRIFGRHHVARRSPPLGQVESARRAVVAPVVLRFLVGGVDDQAIYGGAGH